ncbi:hypothetical protein, partial [Vibrio aestuarianus]
FCFSILRSGKTIKKLSIYGDGKMKQMTLEQAKAVAISEIAKKLGLHVEHKVNLNDLLVNQEKSSKRAMDELHSQLSGLVDDMVRDSLTDHLHGEYESKIEALTKEISEQKKAHESELADLLKRVEAYQ